MMSKDDHKMILASGQPSMQLSCLADIDLVASDGETESRPSFKMKAYNGGPLSVGGFYRPVVVDLAGLRHRETLPILYNHDMERVVGQATAVKVTEKSIELSGVLTGDDETTRQILAHAKNGFKWSASVGVRVDSLESVDAKTKVVVNGRSHEGPIYVVRAGRLAETSIVAIGADENADTKIAAKLRTEANMEFEVWVKAQGFDPETLTEQQATSLRSAFEASIRKESEPVQAPAPAPMADPVAEMRLNASAEIKRISAINKIDGISGDIAAKAIDEGWTPEQAELAVLRASRPAAPAVHSSTQATSGEVLEAAIGIACGLNEIESHYSEQTLNAADRSFRRGISLQEFLLEAAIANGYSGRSFKRDPKGVMRAAFSGRSVNAAVGTSTIDVDDILSNAGNKMLLESFFATDQSWREIAAIRSVNDFKTHTSYRLTGNLQYEKIAPAGKFKHGTLGEDSFTIKADTSGKILGIGREDIINDDLGAFSQIVRMLGRGAGLQVAHEFWTEFMDNSAFFTSGRLNYFDGATSALGIDSLSTAIRYFLTQTDNDGKPLGITPAKLLVPPSLLAMAQTIFKSTEVRDTTASTKGGTFNIHGGRFEPIVSPYLQNSAYTGYSSTAWYLLANPADMATIQVAFLNGQQSPTIETTDADFDTLGINFRGYHDFGVALMEYRAGVKSKGAA